MGDGPQHVVPDRVPEGVVHVLEVVEVDHQHGDGSSGAASGAERPLELLEQRGPVGQTGQRVVRGEVGQLLLVAVTVGDLPPGARDAAVDPHGADVEAVLALAQQLGGVGEVVEHERDPRLDERRVPGEEPVVDVAGEHVEQTGSDQVGPGHAVVAAGGVVHVEEGEVDDGVGVVAHRTEDHVRVDERVEGGLQARAIASGLLPRPHQLVDIAHDTEQPGRLAVVAGHHPDPP